MNLIWATRGRTWGFRFLWDGGFQDPLLEYEEAFRGREGSAEVWQRIDDAVAVRFQDPLGRKDAAGRVVPHDFVVFSPLAERITSVDDGLGILWPLVADEYAGVWDLPTPPPDRGVG